MAELANCSRCQAVFVKTIRDVCQSCYKEEERAFETVYRFLSIRKNREATMMEIVKATEVNQNLIIKFIKEKRLRTSQFPKLAYPCERCGVDIIHGRLCGDCSDDIKNGLEYYDKMESQAKEKEERTNIYYTYENRKK
ncbi:TIGR03826 family flagellar region protein [Virgibacillus litoralis]|uniref:Flagellar operon protein (TIGR03826 family) n=1 Tax=Virgibacillus litoralis TaxID=578221 RepID=A0ABS4HBF6_9BACI|nr:TIGR03826 family flagellar region protein [Virgibacillus litoralis]MBP1947984.1 flagellar operon protein (TIGR03826 family) [Virgibacillus litoralis]